MVLPIIAYGDPVLRKVANDISKEYLEEKNTLLGDMFETMYNAHGVGLAAPQVGLDIRVFVVDTAPFAEDEDAPEKVRELLKGFKKVFINAKILKEEGDEWSFNEGCLSIPDVRENVTRRRVITIEYYDENFEKHTEVYDGLIARVIQHEYDHIEGVLFTDKISMLKRKLIAKRLSNIMIGKIKVDYKMKFPKLKK
ncbi:MAG: peptide deformylase [Flavobacteriales bacterium]|nr:peptide deformylase [Flavobacteriales bacterium]